MVQFRPYQGAKKGKQIASPTKWGLEENIVLRLMECLTPTFSFDIFMIYLWFVLIYIYIFIYICIYIYIYILFLKMVGWKVRKYHRNISDLINFSKWNKAPFIYLPCLNFWLYHIYSFMDNYFTCFRLLTHLRVDKIQAVGVLNKNRLRKCFIIRDKQL